MKKLLVFTAVVFASFLFDQWFINLAHFLKNTPFAHVLLAITDAGTITYICFIIFLFACEKRQQSILSAIFGMIAAYEITGFIKNLTQVPRPYAGDEIFLTLGSASGFSFPSSHAAILFCIYAISVFIFKTHKKKLLAFTIFFALTRAFVGVHYLSDVAGGAMIGLLIGSFIVEKVEKTGFMHKVIAHIKDKLELRRQIAHIITGFAIIFLVKYNVLSLEALLLILIAGGILSFMMRTRDVPIATQVLRWFEREKHIKKFPGRGSFFFVLGSFLSLVFFTQNIAFASIAIMAVGDAVTNIVGTYFGRIKIFYNPQKHIEGLVIAILTATIAAIHFVPLTAGFVAASIAMLVEAIPLQFAGHDIDDNIVIPLVAGSVLTLFT